MSRKASATFSRDYNSSSPRLSLTRQGEFCADQDEEEGEEDESLLVLWSGVPRRPKGESSEGHKPVFDLAKTLLQAKVFSGQGPDGRKSSPFPDVEWTKLDKMMRESWRYIRSVGVKKYGMDASLAVEERPTNVEAKKVNVLDLVW